MEDGTLRTEKSSWETAKLEYEVAVEQYRHFSSLRRQDMAFVTTVQAAVLTIIGSKLLALDFSSLVLSIIAFFVLLLGINSERRLSAYMGSYMYRAREIESEYGMSLLSPSGNNVQKKRLLLSNSYVFPLYFCIFIIAWFTVWALNLSIKLNWITIQS
jgi:hypothetical protein